jgi:MYXO-CTERM domain-containing protein
MTTRNGWMTRSLMGLLLGAVAGSSPGCSLREHDEFVSELASEVCRLQRCGYGLKLPGSDSVLPDDETCELQVEAHYGSCGDRCAYNVRDARRCIRRLSDDICDEADLEEGVAAMADELPLVCDAVFTGCEGEESCEAPFAGVCSVSSRPDPAAAAWALGLLMLGVGARRRRATEAGQ